MLVRRFAKIPAIVRENILARACRGDTKPIFPGGANNREFGSIIVPNEQVYAAGRL